MKILFVVARALEVNTSSSIRNRAVIKGLVDLGHSVEVVSIKPIEENSSFDKSLRIDNVEYTYFEKDKLSITANKFRRNKILNKFRVWMYHMYNKIQIYDNTKMWVENTDELKGKEYDLIISSSDPKSSHLFVKKCFNDEIFQGVKWIQIWGDPFASDITLKNKYLVPLIKKEEAKLLESADVVFYVSRLTLEHQKIMYPEAASKMKSMYIPYTCEKIYKEFNSAEFKVAYCGDYRGDIRNIKPLYEALVEENYKAIICGNSDIELNSTDRVHIYPRVGVKEVDKIENEASVLVHLSNLRGTQIPGKINHYSATNKNILFILDGDERDKKMLKDEYEKYNRYIFCQNNKSDIKRALNEIKKNNNNIVLEPVKEFKSDYVVKEMLKKAGIS